MFYNFYHKNIIFTFKGWHMSTKRLSDVTFEENQVSVFEQFFFSEKMKKKKVHFTVQDKNVETGECRMNKYAGCNGAWNLYVDKTLHNIAIMLSHNSQIELKLVSVSFLKGKTYPKTWRSTSPPPPQIFKILIRRGLGGGDN